MTQQLVLDIIHNRLGAGYTDVEARIDAGGKQFLVVGVAPNAENTNLTQLELYIAAAGQPFPQAPDYVFTTPGGQADKIDAVGIERSGRDLLVYAATHAPGAGNRALHICAKELTGVFDTNPQFEAESNGAGADVIPGEPGGGDTEVDYTRVEAIVEFQVNRMEADLISKFGGNPNSVRQGIEDKAKDAGVELLTGTDDKATQYKDALFQFVKNANAGVQANILGGQDTWGVARRDELKAIIREVLDEE